MGRVLKRVPLDFQWPLNKVWSGYVNPYSIHTCTECGGNGYSKEYEQYSDLWYGLHKDDYKVNPYNSNLRYNAAALSNNITQDDVDALIEADRLWDFTRVPLTDEHREIIKKRQSEGHNSWLPFNNGYKPTADEVNEWNLKTLGHDSTNHRIIIKNRLKLEGKPYTCPSCEGEGVNWQSKTAEEQYHNWKEYDPPSGDGYQLWETTSEGSPVSPVFKSLDELCEWCEDNASTFGRNNATKEEWMKMLSDDNVHHKQGNIIFM